MTCVRSVSGVSEVCQGFWHTTARKVLGALVTNGLYYSYQLVHHRLNQSKILLPSQKSRRNLRFFAEVYCNISKDMYDVTLDHLNLIFGCFRLWVWHNFDTENFVETQHYRQQSAKILGDKLGELQ